MTMGKGRVELGYWPLWVVCRSGNLSRFFDLERDRYIECYPSEDGIKDWLLNCLESLDYGEYMGRTEETPGLKHGFCEER